MASFEAEKAEKKAVFYSIKDGTFRVKTTEDDPEAVKREYVNPKTGASGVAYERSFKALKGTITDIAFRETKTADNSVLRSLHINFGDDDDGTPHIISIADDSRYATDFLKRLPLINLEEEVRILPYDFVDDKGQTQRGMSVTQRDAEGKFTVKVGNTFFQEVTEKTDKKGNVTKVYKNLHGFPEATDEDKSDWKFYFTRVNKFLIKYAKENIVPKFGNPYGASPKGRTEEDFEAPAADEIPFE